jgi:hypothetical protein
VIDLSEDFIYTLTALSGSSWIGDLL